MTIFLTAVCDVGEKLLAATRIWTYVQADHKPLQLMEKVCSDIATGGRSVCTALNNERHVQSMTDLVPSQRRNADNLPHFFLIFSSQKQSCQEFLSFPFLILHPR